MVAALLCGLPQESRIMRKMTGQKYSLQEELLMHILDGIIALAYASRGKKPPISVYDAYHEEEKNTTETFESEDSFKEAWAKATENKK